MKPTRIEVSAADNGWIVTRDGFGRDTTHLTKEAAIKRAAELARQKQPSELAIHRVDGSVQEVRTYGSDLKRILKR